MLFDHCESILEPTYCDPETTKPDLQTGALGPILQLWRALQQTDPNTRLLFTSREALPPPFDARGIALGALSQTDAIELVGRVMREQGLEPKASDPGTTPKQIEALVDAVGRHARALELLAREVARSGVRATTGNLQQLMARLHRQYPDDRQRSLFASLELSLRRLSPQVREQTKALALFRGGTHLVVLGPMLDLDPQALNRLGEELVGVGLAEALDYGHLALDPALAAYLTAVEGVDPNDPALRARWAAGMGQLLG
ncbi:MAG: hypothetical protein GY773_23455, partial [Actinomycetia bacterium]|nr:hypothetical protein [Actinomycetes bacterium]